MCCQLWDPALDETVPLQITLQHPEMLKEMSSLGLGQGSKGRENMIFAVRRELMTAFLARLSFLLL